MSIGKWPRMVMPVFPTICVYSPECLGATLTPFINAPTSNIYIAANRAIYLPFHLEEPATAVCGFAYNGTTVSGNMDIGIYSRRFTRLVSTGSVAQAGTSDLQILNFTDTLLSAGDYYMVFVMDNATGHVFQSNMGVGGAQRDGLLMQASAFALPATGTPVTTTSGFVPLVGISFSDNNI